LHQTHGFGPLSAFPEMKSDPVIKAEVSQDGSDVLFRCMMPKVEDRNVNFFVEWLSNNKVIHTEFINEDQKFSEIDEPTYSGHIDAKNVSKISHKYHIVPPLLRCFLKDILYKYSHLVGQDQLDTFSCNQYNFY
jgi:hypothetical protein